MTWYAVLGQQSLPLVDASLRCEYATSAAGLRVFILPIMLYGSECWAVNKADIQRLVAVDQWCLRRILAQLCQKADIHHITNQPPLLFIIKSRRLTFFGHLARMDENADSSQAIFEPLPENWRRPPGWPHTTWMKNINHKIGLSGD